MGRRVIGWAVLVAMGLALVPFLCAASASPIQVPPVTAPTITLPTLPAALKPVTAIVGPAVATACATAGATGTDVGLGTGVISSYASQLSFSYLPSFLDLSQAPCSATDLDAVYNCSADQQLTNQLNATEAQVATETNLPATFVGIVPIPTTPASTAAETVYAIAVPTGQGATLDKELTSLGCVNTANAAPGGGTTPTTQPPAVAPASTDVTGGTEASGPLTAPFTAPLSSPPLSGATPQSDSAPLGGATTPANTGAPAAAATAPALITQPAVAVHPSKTFNPLALILFVALIVLAGGFWMAAGAGELPSEV